MADIAAVFGWTPAVMDALDLDELLLWQRRAVDRHNRMHGGKA